MIKGIFNDADLNQSMVMVSNKNLEKNKFVPSKKSKRAIPDKYLQESTPNSDKDSGVISQKSSPVAQK
jgi:hypothetical protein